MSTGTAQITTRVSEAEYRKFLSSVDLSHDTKSDAIDIEKIEDLLALRRGTLEGEAYYVNSVRCKCGKDLTFFDFVSTAVGDDTHSKAFMTHALLGNQYGFQTPRTVTCSSCGESHPNSVYKTPSYSCVERGSAPLPFSDNAVKR